MFTRHYRKVKAILGFTDSILISFAFVAAYQTRFRLNFEKPFYWVFYIDFRVAALLLLEWYTDLLDYVRTRYGDQAWFAQPSEVASYWRGLRSGNEETGNAIAWQGSLCGSCRRAHSEGWLSHYPRDRAGSQLPSSTRVVGFAHGGRPEKGMD
jgi:hypothetical protein